MAEDEVVILMSVVGQLGGESDPLPYDEVYSYWSPYFTTTYFMNDPPVNFNTTPSQLVIDLETMKILGKGNSADITVEQMVTLVQQAAAD
jgi:hypothetical protein